MGLFKKVKDILFDEEEYTEQIKITPEMRNEAAPSKDDNKQEKKVEAPATPLMQSAQMPKREITREMAREPQRENINKEYQDVREAKAPAQEELSERDLFKSDPTFPFLDFDEKEFDMQNNKAISRPESPKRNLTNVSPAGPKRSTNVFEYERKKKIEKRTDYGKYEKVETTETIERRKFKPSPIISPVYGVLNKDYSPDEVVSRKSPSERSISIKEVRDRAFGEKKEVINEENDHTTYYEESKTVSITKPEEKVKKVKTIDELLEDTSDVVVDMDNNLEERVNEIMPKTQEEEDIKTQEMKISKSKSEDDTLENDLFDLIDSMYDNKEDGE